MIHTIVLALLAGLMGANAVPHFIKGIVGEEFPNVWGNGPLRNAVAGTLGLAIAVAFGCWADLPAHTAEGLGALFFGALVMAVFHALGGAYKLNSTLRLPNPAHPTSAA
ncbi:hypothetical protein BJY24_000180 [Nocardia transvalensis]|uniref:Uncharacterized protein n=1 Tax=Nocardia transvalensis TaxID=37333 RepID=A0A7W9UFK7_9NOCA|nr:hypothetical protein [Nocardia transvalensis]MBB5911313.1 hypothetical protein [Nocardia transvalensis]